MEQPYTLPDTFDALRFLADLYAEDGELFEAEVSPPDLCPWCNQRYVPDCNSGVCA